MAELAVWAPHAGQVVVHLPNLDHRELMIDSGDGWWHLDCEKASTGTDYQFSVDGGEPRPDPRSAWQPHGVHGPSRVFDAAEYQWSDGEWRGRRVTGDVIYELHIGTFTSAGTLDAAIERLDHLVHLGVDVVELLPVAAFDGDRGWGYDGVHLWAVHETYGGPRALQRFVDACHARGLAVCLDVVYNHLGSPGNYLPEFGPYFTEEYQTPWGAAVNLGEPEVRRWIIDNAVRWFTDFHIDALRLDAVHALVDHSPRHILSELSDEIRSLSTHVGRKLTLIAESDLNDPVVIESTDAGGYGLDAQWDDDIHHALHAWVTGERQGYYCDFGSTAVVKRVFTEAFRHAGEYSTFRDSVWGTPIDPAKHRGHQFVAALQTHDQVGNRAAGERLSILVGPGRLATAAALLLTGPFTPMLFMGEEWATDSPWQFFTSFNDPDLAQAVRIGRREEFEGYGWDQQKVPDPQDPATRDRSVLPWHELYADPASGSEHEDPYHAEVFEWYRKLIELRRAEPALRDDDLTGVHVEAGDTWIVVHRGDFRIVVNLAPAPLEIPCDATTVLLAWGDVTATPGGLTMAADSVAVARA